MNKLLYMLLLTTLILVNSTAHSVYNNLLLVSKIEWSLDGTQLLIALEQGGLYLVDPITQTTLLGLSSSVTGAISDAALQPGGDLIATVNRVNTLNLWSSDDGTLIRSITDIIIPYRVDWSPDGRYIFTSGIDEIYLRDVMGNPLFSIAGEPEDLPNVAFSSNSEQLLLSFSHKMEVWEITSQQMLVRSRIGGLRRSIQWNMDGTAVLAANISLTREGNLHNIVVIDPMTGERLRIYEGFPEQLTSAYWSPDETQILATSVDGTAYLVDAESGVITPIFKAEVPLLSADWSPYGGQVAIGTPISAEQTLTEGEIAFADVPVQILVPDPTLNRLNAIAKSCLAPEVEVTSIRDETRLPEFVTTIEALSDQQIPLGCKADLLAIANAIAP